MLSKAGIVAPCFHVVNWHIVHLYKTQARVILLWKAATPAVLLEVSRHDILDQGLEHEHVLADIGPRSQLVWVPSAIVT